MANVSNAELAQEINALKSRLIGVEKVIYDMGAKFALYHTQRRSCFAIISRLGTDRKTQKPNGLADLVVFHHGWSGGHDVVLDVPLWIHDPALNDEENPKDEKWVPMLEISEITETALREYEESRLEREKENDSKETKALFKKVTEKEAVV